MKALDYHFHSYFSADSEENPRNHVLEALENQLTEICFTEHRDFHFPGMKFDLDTEKYFAEIRELQAEFEKKITIKIGLEIGLDYRYQAEIEQFIAEKPYDFVIGSVHEIDDIEVYDDTEYYVNKSKNQAHLQYLENVLKNVQTFDCYNSLGHLDYVARYGPYKDKFVKFDEFEQLIGQILQVLVAKNKALEVNTRLFEFPETVNFYENLLVKFREFGGKQITLGTDNHEAQRDFAKLESARKLILETGFDELATFDKMKIEL